jgi:hypothetical protein
MPAARTKLSATTRTAFRAKRAGNRHIGGDRRPDILSFQARKIRQNFLDVISTGQAGEHRAKRNPSTPKHGFSAADLRIADDAFVEEVWHSVTLITALMEATSRTLK